MIYDFDELAKRVKSSKRSFVIKLLVYIAVSAGAIVACALLNNEVLIIPTVLIVAVMVLFSARVIKRSSPLSLFSSEIKGYNIKEYEYSAPRNEHVNVGYPKARMVTMPHTFANRKSIPPHLRGRVYLRLENGNIKEIGGLYKAHMEIYEDGDLLFKPRGARFPIVLCREVTEQPCPCCGEVNSPTDATCSGCGLGIVCKTE